MKEVFQISSVPAKASPSYNKAISTGFNIRQLLIGSCVLILGILLYYFFRSAEHTYFLKFLSINHNRHKILLPAFVSFGNSLPTFIHVLAFSLMTAAFVARRRKGYAIVCLFWFAIDVLFELGQSFGDMIIPAIPSWFSNFLFLENTGDYFLHGRFDYLDLLSIALGSLAAYIILIKTKGEEEGGK
jgi:hypothetical protein